MLDNNVSLMVEKNHKQDTEKAADGDIPYTQKKGGTI